jgi:hypothetical protein
MVGTAILSVTSINGITGDPPNPWGAFLGLFFIALGTGGIKPCVSAFGGDQFKPHQKHLIQVCAARTPFPFPFPCALSFSFALFGLGLSPAVTFVAMLPLPSSSSRDSLLPFTSPSMPAACSPPS